MKSILEKIYAIIPFKKYIFNLLKLVYKPSKNIYQHLHFKDSITVKVDPSIQFKMMHFGYQIENEIYWNGLYNGWEKYSLKVWTELSKNSSVIFDIGANTGIYSMISKAVNTSSKVYAFEPVERVIQKLEINNKLNNFDCILQQKAVSDKSGTATIYDKDTDHTYSVTVNKDISPDKSDSIEVEIDTIRLDDYIKESNINHIDLMKVDVETHEVEALEGMGSYLKEYAPSILIEILNNEVADGVEKLIEGINYQFFNIDEKLGIKKVDNLKDCYFRNFLICTPEVAKKINVENINLNG